MAKMLRKNFTDTERLLWKYLRGKQIEEPPSLEAGQGTRE
jgi:very-short-patch-repair endonuclease